MDPGDDAPRTAPEKNPYAHCPRLTEGETVDVRSRVTGDEVELEIGGGRGVFVDERAAKQGLSARCRVFAEDAKVAPWVAWIALALAGCGSRESVVPELVRPAPARPAPARVEPSGPRAPAPVVADRSLFADLDLAIAEGTVRACDGATFDPAFERALARGVGDLTDVVVSWAMRPGEPSGCNTRFERIYRAVVVLSLGGREDRARIALALVDAVNVLGREALVEEGSDELFPEAHVIATLAALTARDEQRARDEKRLAEEGFARLGDDAAARFPALKDVDRAKYEAVRP